MIEPRDLERSLNGKHRAALTARPLIDRLQLPGSRIFVDRFLGDARGRIRIKLSTGVRMEVDLSDRVQRLEAFRAYERRELELMRSKVRTGDTVLDVGAHAGYYALHAARLVGPSGHVHAFEPVPSNAVTLRRNVMLNRFTNVTVNECAVSRVSGTSSFSCVSVPGETGWGSLTLPPDPTVSAIDVRTIAIDDYVREAGLTRVDFIKMDVQGAERDVLLGARDVIATHRPRILCEVVEGCSWQFGYTAAQFLRFVRSLGYEPWYVPPRGAPVAIEGDEPPGPTLFLEPR